MQIFGLETKEKNAKLILIPVPWEVTASYGSGTALGPELIFEASSQVDLFDIETQNAFECGYFMLPINKNLKIQNNKLRKQATKLYKKLQASQSLNKQELTLQKNINKACVEMNNYVYAQAKSVLKSGKMFGVIGGDHSTPLGAIRAIGEFTKGNFGLIHIDAHLDLREAYLGFQDSHASIMNNVSKLKYGPQKIIQFGIRDFCEEEVTFMQQTPEKFHTYFDIPTKKELLSGRSWLEICREAISQLPENIYISFDIDGLDPTLCPGTGTPVPGGLSFEQMLVLLSTIHEQGKKIIGFDLVEVSAGINNDEWNGNVGARVLYKLCGWSMVTQGFYKLKA